MVLVLPRTRSSVAILTKLTRKTVKSGFPEKAGSLQGTYHFLFHLKQNGLAFLNYERRDKLCKSGFESKAVESRKLTLSCILRSKTSQNDKEPKSDRNVVKLFWSKSKKTEPFF